MKRNNFTDSEGPKVCFRINFKKNNLKDLYDYWTYFENNSLTYLSRWVEVKIKIIKCIRSKTF